MFRRANWRRVRLGLGIVLLLVIPLLWLGGCMWQRDHADPLTWPAGVAPQTAARSAINEELKGRFGERYITREGWGAAQSDVMESYTAVKGIVIHHSGHQNTLPENYTWEKRVKEIQEDHINIGWKDIGYHFLIDPNGKIYEGRIVGGDHGAGIRRTPTGLEVVEGAHAVDWNTGFVGINFLGCFLSRTEWNDQSPAHKEKHPQGKPSDNALKSAMELIKWIVDNAGNVSLIIIAHRDVSPGKPHCPGWNVYTHLPAFRDVAGIRTKVSLSPTFLHLPAEGGTADVEVKVESGHPWQAYRDEAWISFEGGSDRPYVTGKGPDVVRIRVAPNTSPQLREGKIVIGGVLLTITQGNRPPNTPTGANQFRSDGRTVIPEGGITNESTMVFTGTVSDPDRDQVRLQIELRRIDEPFTGTPTWESRLVPSGTQVSWTHGGLIDARYKWRYRAVDARGLASPWVEFGTPRNTDFVVDRTRPTPPRNLRVTASTFWRIDLAWAPSTDNLSGVAFYRIYRDGRPYETVPGTQTSFRDGNVRAGRRYCYQVSAVDRAGNESFLSNVACARAVPWPR